MYALLAALLTATPCEAGVLASFAPGGARIARKSARYDPPAGETLKALSRSIAAMIDGDVERVEELARAAQYGVCTGVDDEAELALWHPTSNEDGHASIVVRTGEARALIVEVPHPISDYRTLPQGVSIFSTLR